MQPFTQLLGLCKEINPSSFTGEEERRRESVTKHGLDLVPKEWNWRGREVLILGCGDGYEIKYARQHLGWEATGLTFLPLEMQRVDELYNCSKYAIQADMHDLQGIRRNFHHVYSKECLEHSPCPILALIELNRVIRLGGSFFHLIPEGWDKQRDWYHFSCFPDWVWCDLFRKAGFEVIEILAYPNCDRATFSNKAYIGKKVAHVDYGANIDNWRKRLGYEHMRGTES